jgi:decaprenylphospho-beta-D-erythro-pentofuranosid-2-ulose 2-reductase
VTTRPALGKVVVFGATSAIAQATTRLLAGRGAELFLVGRNREKLEAVADDARTRGAAQVTTAAMDLNDTSRHGELLASAASALGRIDVVLVAQGVLADSDACERDLPLVRLVLDTNFVAPALLCEAAAARLVEQGAGTIVGISSVAGDRGRQSNYAYGAAKGALARYLEGLRNRVFRRGVHVLTVKPGFVDSPMTAHVPKNALFAPASVVAAAIVRGVERRRDEIYVPGFWRAIMWVIRHVPERIFKRLRM